MVGVGLGDPITLIGSASMLLAATLAAAWIPTVRATRIDPVVALRKD